MGLFDSIERLITEHGSAAILKERLSLAAERHAALERENADLKRRLADSENVIARRGHLPLRLDLNTETRDELLLSATGGWENLPRKLLLGYGISLTATSASKPTHEMLGRATDWLPFGKGQVRSGWLFHAWNPVPAPDHTFMPFKVYALNARHAVVFFKVHVMEDGTGYIHVLSASDDVCLISLQTTLGTSVSGEFRHGASGGQQESGDTWHFNCDFSVGAEKAT